MRSPVSASAVLTWIVPRAPPGHSSMAWAVSSASIGWRRVRVQATTRWRAGEVAGEIEVVGRLVHQDAAALALPGAAPGRLAVVAGGAGPAGEHVDALKLAEAAFVQEALRGDDLRAVAELEADGEESPGALGGGDHRIGLADVDGHRLLAEDVAAGLQGGDGDLGVEGVRRHDDDDVRAGRLEHALVVREGGAAKLLGALLGEGGVRVGDADDLGGGQAEGRAVHPEHGGTGADDGVTKQELPAITPPWPLIPTACAGEGERRRRCVWSG